MNPTHPPSGIKTGIERKQMKAGHTDKAQMPPAQL